MSKTIKEALETEEGRRKLGEVMSDMFEEARRRAFVERFREPPNIFPPQEKTMPEKEEGMEKRAVVMTEKEKTAHEKLKKELPQKFVDDLEKKAPEKEKK